MFFHDLKIKNFKSFVGTHRFDFDVFCPGLNFLTGKNLVEPDLGSNGVGKSTLWDAVCWILYGQTLRGVRAGQIPSWKSLQRRDKKHRGSKRSAAKDVLEPSGRGPKDTEHVSVLREGGCSGSIRLGLGSKELEIYRSWKPNRLWVVQNNKRRTVTQDQLESLIGLDADSFQQSIIIGQFSRMFFDRRPNEKLKLFSDLLNLDYWQGKSKFASEHHSALVEEWDEVDRQIVGVVATIVEVKRGLVDEQKLAKVAEAKWIKQTKFYRDEMITLSKKKRVYSKKIKRLSGKIKLLKDINTVPTNPKIVRMEQDISKLTETRENLEIILSTIRSDLRSSEEQLSRISEKALKKGICPVCGQKIKKSHVKDELLRLQETIKGYKKNGEKNAGLLESVEERLELATVSRDKALEDYKRDEERRQRLVNIRTRVVANLENTVLELERLDRELLEIKNSKVEQAESIQNFKRRLRKLREKSEKLKTSKNDLEGIMEAVNFWVKGFKDIRLSIVEDALTVLGVEVNNYLGALGMEEWSMKFSVERETKGGNVSRGFHITVRSPTSPHNGSIPLEAWSGGEGQRLRLAATLAFQPDTGPAWDQD